ncbi:YjbH domain-containing protein [Cyclobacterium sp. SYSU L10401]|uniref:YjbH domain-containing protein n=1 Tax=Cyclobacterium sp. SYSU L10401 TaxID=2678657 RepID=UPI0013D6D930|nr:YjbH domain-containing protein [Cyclobacterium sp. SYSU L10401]
MKSRVLLLVACLLAGTALAQDKKAALQRAGFEQVHLWDRGDSSLVFFAHRNFRNPYHSMRWADRQWRDTASLAYVPLLYNRPMGVYGQQDLRYRPLDAGEKAYFKKVNRPFSGYRWSFRIHPDLAVRFGNKERPFESRTHLILDTRVFLLPGLSVQTGLLIPIQNALDNRGMHLRLAPSHLHYFWNERMPHFLGITAGTFYNDRYGINLQYRYDKLDRPWSWGLELARTGFYLLPPWQVYTEGMNDMLALADVQFRWNAQDLTFKVTAGQFLFRDRGVRGDLIRQYGGVDLGLFAAATRAGIAAGFNFTFPLFPGKIARGRNWELRTTEAFQWEYSYTNAGPIGQRFRMGMPRLDRTLRQYKASFLQSQGRPR